MAKSLNKICYAQINPTLGDIDGNAKKIIESIIQAKKLHADLIVFPELVITGYPPKDLLFQKSFVKSNITQLNKIIAFSEGIFVVIGFVEEDADKIYNSAAIIYNGKLIGIQRKTHLPNYDVFDEKRYFSKNDCSEIFDMYDKKVGITICEDIWEDGPVETLRSKGAELIVNISASPFHMSKEKTREKTISQRASSNNIPIIYCNIVGGQDDLIFDGHSYYFDNSGKKLFEAPSFEEGIFFYSINDKKINYDIDDTAQVYKALILGIKDYFSKNNFQKAIIGLSGGIDSALTACLAVEALGKENILGITMPSMYSSSGSIDDSYQLSKNLGIQIKKISIKNIYDAYMSELLADFKDSQSSIAEENIQARVRGNILMAFSNKFGYIVLSTGNKSELAVGYCTLYGDMSGGLAVISDIPKTLVYTISKYYNLLKGRDIIPQNTLEKPPSAELRPNQKDSDSLPEYDILDKIIELYVENHTSVQEIIDMGYERKLVEKIIKLIKNNEYKRYQAALGFKVTSKAFGSGRRIPITNKY